MRSVESVLNQSHKNFELIMIDDASTDGSMDEIANLDDPRIVTDRRETPGPGGYAARNLGIERARNEWIAFLDADDQWNSEILAEFIKLMESYPEAGILCTGFIYKKGEREIVNDYTTHQAEPNARKIGIIEYLSETRKGRCPVHTSCVCIKKDLLKRIGGFPEGRCRRGGDRDTWLRAVDQSDIAWSPYIGELYYCDSVNMVTKTVPEGEGCSLQTLEKLIDRYSGDSRNARLTLELRRLENNLLEIKIKKKAKDGHLHISDIRGYSFPISPCRYIFYSVLAFLPDSIIIGMLKMFFILKKFRAEKHS